MRHARNHLNTESDTHRSEMRLAAASCEKAALITSRCLSLCSPALLERVCWRLAVFPALQSFVFTLSVCPLSLAACSGPFIVCCLLYQFLLVPSAPRVFSLSASGVFWSWPVLCWGPTKVCEEWCVRCCVEASGMRLRLKRANLKTPNWLFSEDGWTETRGSCKGSQIKNKRKEQTQPHKFCMFSKALHGYSCLLVAPLGFIV